MINSRDDYIRFNKLDKKIMMIEKNLKKPRLFRDYCWKFVRLLRKTEYYNNCKKGIFGKIILNYYKIRFNRLSLKLGFSIPLNTIDEGAGIFHYGTIIINGNARIGKRCHIHCHTNFADGVEIGNDVYIGPGAKILNNVKIADGIRIGANAVVNKSFLEENITIAGVPAKKVSNNGMYTENIKNK